MLKPRSFDIHKNVVVPMIVILDYLEVDTEVSDIDIKTVESNDYREMLEDNRGTNDILAAI